MEQELIIGNSKVFTYVFGTTKEIEVLGNLFTSYNNGACVLNINKFCNWKLSKEELCTFIKLLVSHLELPLEFK